MSNKADSPLAIAQVTPYPWESQRELNEYVERLSQELAGCGHSVLVLAPSGSRVLVRESRAAIRSASSNPASLFEPGAVRVLAMGQSVPVTKGRRGGRMALPLDITRTIEKLLATLPLDVLHVHEPFAPSASAAALRHSRAINVGTFHSPTERVLSTQVARRFIELFFGRLDARIATFDVTRSLISGFFPGDYELIHPGADTERYRPLERDHNGPVEIAYADVEERSALRVLLRALRGLEPDGSWHATIWTERPLDTLPRLSKALRQLVRYVGPDDVALAELFGEADVCCAASGGLAPAALNLLKGVAAGAVPVSSRIPIYEEMLDGGDNGLLFEPAEHEILTAQLGRLVRDGELRARLHERCLARRDQISWRRVADQVEQTYVAVLAKRHDNDAKPAVQRRLAKREFIYCDLHMHTDHSPDCATPVDVLLDSAKRAGLGAIAVTDHNEVSGALEARERANGIKVIVAEEIKTDHEGEVIGLFVEEKIPRGMSLRETLDAIHAQGGLAYVPHPFDRMHSVPDYEYLLKVVEDIDSLEVFNARVAVPAFNEEARRFADKYRIVAGAGSDSHVPQGLGTVKIRMRDFDGPEEFLESLRDADLLHKRKSLVYLQSLKFLQTKARPGKRASASKH